MRPRKLFLNVMLCFHLAACGPSDLFAGDFMNLPFGQAGLKVSDLDEETVQSVMNAVQHRILSYLELREHIPFEVLSTPDCLSEIEQTLTTVRFNLDVACALPGASGEVLVFEEDISSDGTTVTRLILDYRDVTNQGFSVDGLETIVETDPEQQGSSQRTLDLVQNADELDYTFRLGAFDEERLALDYKFQLPKGELPVRLIIPSGSPGSIGTVLLQTIDGGLQCELRNTSDEADAKGFCENGLTFGLP